MAYSDGKRRSIESMEAKHWINHPAHASELVRILHGHVSALYNSDEDDPLLYAYLCKDHLPKIAGLIIQVQKWVTAVVEATPDQVYEDGAQICR